jgi:hypothetical protein
MLILLLVIVNTPLVHSVWTQWRVGTSGTTVHAEVTRARVLTPTSSPSYWITFVYEQSIDPAHTEWPAEIGKTTFDRAVATHQVAVRVLPGHPAAYRVAGQVRNWTGLWLTLFADASLLGLIWLSRRYAGSRRPPPLRVAAIEAVARGPLEPLIEQVEGDLYLIRGEVLHLDEHELIIDAGEREVIVILDGHPNPVGRQQPAQVRGRLVG